MHNSKMVLLYPFHVSLLRRGDYRHTWDEHGGLAGHIDFGERHRLEHKRNLEDLDFIDHVIKKPMLFPVLPEYIDDLNKLRQNFEKMQQVTDVEFDLFWLSGFSRSGGTYIQKEYAKMKNFDIRREHIHFCHDYFPKQIFRAVIDYKEMLDDLHTFFAAYITHARYHGRKEFFNRTVIGGLMLPYIVRYARIVPGMSFQWKHIIRDVHGAFKSLKRYFNVEERSLDEVDPNRNWGSLSYFQTEFGNTIIKWFMSNVSILPTMRGLPFWDVVIDGQQSQKRIISDVRNAVDIYISNNSNTKFYEIGCPRVLKFGSNLELQCLNDGMNYRPDGSYKPGKFNFQPVPEIDDRYSGVYEELVVQLTKLYNSVGIDFDGILERV